MQPTRMVGYLQRVPLNNRDKLKIVTSLFDTQLRDHLFSTYAKSSEKLKLHMHT